MNQRRSKFQPKPNTPVLQRGVTLSEEESKWRENLKEIFDLFDRSGDGEISLAEMKYELCTIPGVKMSEGAMVNITNQFNFMDSNLDGSVTFPEFFSAVTAAMRSSHKTLQKEHEVADFGFELFTLMSLYQRYKLHKEDKADAYEIEGEPLEQYGRIRKAHDVSLLSVDLIRELRHAKTKKSDILEKKLNALNNEELLRDIDIARNQWKQTQKKRRKKWEEENKQVQLAKLLNLVDRKDLQLRHKDIDRLRARRMEKQREKLATNSSLPSITAIPNSIDHCFNLKPIDGSSFKIKKRKKRESNREREREREGEGAGKNFSMSTSSIISSNSSISSSSMVSNGPRGDYPVSIAPTSSLSDEMTSGPAKLHELTRVSESSRIRQNRLAKLKKGGAASSFLFITT